MEVNTFVLDVVLVALTAISGLVAVASDDEKQRKDALRVLAVCLGVLTAAAAVPATGTALLNLLP